MIDPLDYLGPRDDLVELDVAGGVWVRVPAPEADLKTIWVFALCWYGYLRYGGFKPLAEAAGRCSRSFLSSGHLPDVWGVKTRSHD